MTDRRRLTVFAVLAAACLAGAAMAIAATLAGGGSSLAGSAAAARKVFARARADGRSVAVFRTGTKAVGPIAVAEAGQAAGPRTLTPLSCARVYYTAGRGLCLAPSHSLAPGYQAEVFGPEFKVIHSLTLAGVPSRARISPDGRYGAVTMFVTGHSYAQAGQFSTATTIIDLATGAKVADLEQFTVTKGEQPVTAIDVNYWGVTFARDSNRFYATLATGGQTYLIEGSVSDRTGHVLHDNVECPSLSPDGTRIAFKRRTGSSDEPWRLTVLDLRTMRETPLAERRSVDDQAEWLDSDHVLYGLHGQIWSVPADGSGHPRRFAASADSPAIVR